MDRRQFIGSIAAAAALTSGTTLAVEEYRMREARLSGYAVGRFRPPHLTDTTLVWRAHTSQPLAAITFDDGPDPRYTPDILDILDEHNVVATFFMQGKHVENYPDLARRVAERHAVGNHSYSHPDLSNADAQRAQNELGRTHKIIESTTGVSPTVFRPPYGHLSGATSMVAAGMGYDIVLWSDRLDSHAAPAGNISRLRQAIQPGAIVLGHDGGSLPNFTVIRALPSLLSHLVAQGITLVSVPDLLETAKLEKAQRALAGVPHDEQPPKDSREATIESLSN